MTDIQLPGALPETYAAQLSEKTTRLSSQFAEFSPPLLEVFSSPVSHYRLRAEFRLWHEGERCFFVMFEPGDRSKTFEVSEFPTGSELINRLMKDLLGRIQDQPVLRRRLFQVEFLTTLSGDALITLIYHRKLEDDWRCPQPPNAPS